MNVLFVHAFPPVAPGGAEASIRHFMDHAPAGVRTRTSRPDEKVDLECFDAVVLANIRPHGGAGESAEYSWADEWSARLGDYRGYSVRQEHDTHPCTYRDARCFSFAPLLKQDCGCNSRITRAFERLYNTCSVVQFVSPMQQALINRIIEIRVEQVAIAPPVDFSRFACRVPPSQRENMALVFSDPLRTSPRATEIAKRHGMTPRILEYLSVPPSDMPELLNSVRAVVLDPVVFHACPRLAIEAQACGCLLLANEKVGSNSWPDALGASRCANERFWELVAEGTARTNTLSPYQ